MKDKVLDLAMKVKNLLSDFSHCLWTNSLDLIDVSGRSGPTNDLCRWLIIRRSNGL
jgi:hypothetical protein